ncbi:MAG: hypothetical protein IT382_00620 [Deltaproteobacteria bacterium]|nr:hypothetical protein [Deltaproteobacteria bacterium]
MTLRWLLAACLTALSWTALSGLAACPRAGTEAATTATAAPSPNWWMSLKDGQLHRGLDEAPIGLYVGGDMEGEHFSPGGNIEGNGPFDAKGEPAVMDLRSGRVSKASEPRPAPPFVEGTLTPAGFSPRSRTVTY